MSNYASSRHRPAILGLLVVLALLLAGCGQEATPATPSGSQVSHEVTVIPPTNTLAPTITPTPMPTDTPTVTPTATVTPTPTRDPHISPLTGQHVDDPALINRRVLAVRIGNDPNIRPQEGLGLADVVYEELMEGGQLTRFTALFLESTAKRLRPIRSARLSSLVIAPQYDAALAHSGASDEIRYRISQADFVDLDQFYHPKPYGILAGYDWRGRMYTSVPALRDYLAEKGWEREEPIEGYTFDPTPPEGQPATSIRIPYPSLSVVDWKYDEESGKYLRYVRGASHNEGLTGEQIAADNVIILYAVHEATNIIEDSLGGRAIDIKLAGSGRAQVIRDGVVVEATWSHEDLHDLIEYYDEDGEIIPLRPGKTWIQLVPVEYEVEIQ
ncbi:MAG: DUF3048 domain-containing protein [Chloroflexi bacterium]|nr:DUF3048 domain-containing protein [Chloroflexota bacterium]